MRNHSNSYHHKMKKLILLLLPAFLSLSSAKPVTRDGETPMLQMLDAMQQLMTGDSQFDRVFYDQLRTCLFSWDTQLENSQDAAWQGIINYWLNNGSDGDAWGSFNTNYMEQNATSSEFLNMTIYEPCNYASNVAYYHDVTEFCSRRDTGDLFSLPQTYVDALGKSFAALAVGSSFMHLSHTELGHQQDVVHIEVIAYLLHQGSLLGFPDASSILTDLSPEPRRLTAVELADEFMLMYSSLPVEEWYNHTKSFDLPDYYLSFAGIFTTVFTLVLEPEKIDALLPVLADVFGLSDEIYTFISEGYLPELRNLTADLDLGIVQEAKFLEDAISAIGKLVYALLWQEETLGGDYFLNETVNIRGWELLPEINNKLNILNTFEYDDWDFQNGTNIYPGDEWCNPVMPHAKWHLEAGIGLLDLAYLGDELNRILSPQTH